MSDLSLEFAGSVVGQPTPGFIIHHVMSFPSTLNTPPLNLHWVVISNVIFDGLSLAQIILSMILRQQERFSLASRQDILCSTSYSLMVI